jgi:AcrR family transcriptional regulator
MSGAAPRGRGLRLTADERRRRLIEATILVLARDGVQGAGVRSVCRELGVAPGLVTHFFGGWRGLLTAAYRHLQSRFQDEFDAALAAPAPSAADRIAALIDWFFTPRWLDDVYAGAHVALWALSRSETDLRAIMTEFYGRQRDGLARAVAAMAAEQGAEVAAADLADAMLLFLNGLWMEMILNPGHIPAERGRRLAEAWFADTALGRGRR